MKHIYLFLSIIVLVCHTDAQAKINCPEDVFPLDIGTQWTYRYYWQFEDLLNPVVIFQQCDTGIVTIQIIDKLVTADSTRWFLKRNSTLWSQMNNGSFWGPTINIDTLELIELHQDSHQLYQLGDHVDIRHSVIPFEREYYDSTKVYRYQHVDNTGACTFESFGLSDGYWYTYTFKHDVGELSVVIRSTCLCGWTEYGNHTLLSSSLSSVQNSENDIKPTFPCLDQNYPNPFNPTTVIRFEIQERCKTKLEIFDALGRCVSTLVDEEKPRGNYEYSWNASHLSSGVYFYRLTAGTEIQTRRMIFLK
jgi:hypothetical protein